MKLKFETSAGGIVYKKIKEQKSKSKILWLTTKHSHYKKWTFPKGLIGDTKKEEEKEEAALREVKEEGGVHAKIINHQPIKVQYSYRLEDFLVKKTVYYFLMQYISGDPKDHDWEVEEAKFVTDTELKKMLSFETDKKAFEEILRSHSLRTGLNP